MTAEVSVERSVAAPAGAVWALVADVTRMGEWSPETTGCRWTGGAAGPAVGARFRGSNANGGHRWSTSCTVTDADPGRCFAFEVTVGPVKVARWEYRLEDDGSGCRVVETWTDRRGSLASRLGKPLSGVGDRTTHNRSSMEETLRRLAVAAEAGGDPS